MNDQSNEFAPPNPSNQAEQQAPPPVPEPQAQQNEPGQCFFNSLRSAFRSGARDARNAARKAAPKAKSLAAQVGYGLAYGVSFSAVFPYTLAERLAPDCVRAGWGEGLKEGRQSASRAAENIKNQAQPTPPVMDVPSAEPGTAS